MFYNKEIQAELDAIVAQHCADPHASLENLLTVQNWPELAQQEKRRRAMLLLAKLPTSLLAEVEKGRISVQSALFGELKNPAPPKTAPKKKRVLSDQDIDRVLSGIALRHAGITTLEIQNNDARDFHEVSVWALKAALRDAFDAGQAS